MRISQIKCAAIACASVMLTPALCLAADVTLFNTAKVSLNDAVMAAEKASGGKAVDVDFTKEKDMPTFDVTIARGDATEHYTVNAGAMKAMAVQNKGLLAKLDHEPKKERVAAQIAPVSMTSAVSKAESATGGKAIEAELETSGKMATYEIELVKNGETIKSKVDAASGDVVKQ